MHFRRDQDWGRLPVTDALRAVAILAVVLFHTFPLTVPGGFIGVDVFFVISGFVIALNYLPGLVEKEISFSVFFLRRIRRLLPALLVMIVLVSLISFIILRPVHLKAFGESLATQAIFSQNFAFWVQGEYFDHPNVKPLLHTWSLGVEEQFYFLFPLLVLAFRRGYRSGIAVLAAVAASSFFIGFKISPITPKTVFYLVPFRIWEFSGGIVIALWYLRSASQGRLPSRPALALLIAGVVALAFAIVGFNESARLPGLQSVLAVAGTMAVCAAQRSIGPRLIALSENRIVQHIGRTSYSWYLWHWPVVVFYFVLTDTMPTLVPGLILLLLGYALGTMSYAWLERGNQRRAYLAGNGRALAALAVLSASGLALGVTAFATNGAMFRYPTGEARLLAAQMDHTDGRCRYWQRIRDYRLEMCRIGQFKGPAGILLVGDSHSAKTADLLREIADRKGIPLYITKRDCRPTSSTVSGYCGAPWWKDVFADARDLHIARVVIVAHYPPPTTPESYASAFERFADQGFPLYLLRSPPEGPWFDPLARIDPSVQTASLRQQTVQEYETLRAGQRDVMAQLVARHPNVVVLDPIPYLCPNGRCLRDDPISGWPLYSDQHHLDTQGIQRMAPAFAPLFSGLPH